MARLCADIENDTQALVRQITSSMPAEGTQQPYLGIAL